MTRMKRTGEGPCPCLVVSLLLRLGLLLCPPSTPATPRGWGAPHGPVGMEEGGKIPGESWGKVCTLRWGSPSYL